MLKPSYAELMDIMNKDNEKGDDIKSRYTVVIAAAKRARQLIEGDKPMIDAEELADKPLSVAVEELKEGKIKVVPEGMGTVIHIEKESLEDEIKSELEAVSSEFEGDEDDDFSDEFSSESAELGEEDLEGLDSLDFEE